VHAVLVNVNIESGREDEARSNLDKNVVPMTRKLPGAIAGYWLEPQSGQGYSTILFDTEEHAKAAAEGVRGRVPEYVTVNHVQVQEVLAHF
jgi:hypothetical protein